MTIEQSQELISKLIKYREKAKLTNSRKDKLAFEKYERLCIEKFKYLVTMKLSRYRNFNNYEDLMQDGLEALVNAMKTYNPKKGNWFWWCHKYIDTRISRCANLHTTIRFPLKYAKQVTPHRESVLPQLVDQMLGPYDILEHNEMINTVKKNFDYLPGNQKQVLQLLFGMNGESPHSIAQVCQQLHISRPACVKLLDQVINTLKKNTQI